MTQTYREFLETTIPAYKVNIISGNVVKTLATFHSLEQAYDFADSVKDNDQYDYTDENGFVWDMDIENVRLDYDGNENVINNYIIERRVKTMASTKKMSKKEFEQILQDANADFEIFGYEGLLNFIILAKQHVRDDIKRRTPNSPLIDCYGNDIDTIYEALDKRGYYDR